MSNCGNKHYTNTLTREEYEIRCQNEDPIGFSFVFGEEEEFSQPYANNIFQFFPDGSSEPILELKTYLEMKEEHQIEQQYKETDVVRKYQLDYDESICMVEKFPEAMQIDGVIRPIDNEYDEPNQNEDG